MQLATSYEAHCQGLKIPNFIGQAYATFLKNAIFMSHDNNF